MNRRFFKRPPKHFRKKGKPLGFSLIELLVVIAIIGILATLAVVAFQNSRASSRDARRLADMKNIQTAIWMYLDRVGEFPPYESDVAICLEADTSSIDGDSDGNLFISGLQEENIMARVPGDPLDPETPPITCPEYGYYYVSYVAGDNGCDPSYGPYFVLGVKKFERTEGTNPQSPGFACTLINWGNDFGLSWVTGGFMNR